VASAAAAIRSLACDLQPRGPTADKACGPAVGVMVLPGPVRN
jgi:hypothetical protein